MWYIFIAFRAISLSASLFSSTLSNAQLALTLLHVVTFRMYDLDADGYITKVEMTTVVDTFFKVRLAPCLLAAVLSTYTASCQLVSPLLTYSGKKYDSTEQLVEEFFEQMDANGDGRITLDEFKEGAMKNSDVVQGLKLFSD
jgi:Ca2+-binding EF-hand superfamily protein